MKKLVLVFSFMMVCCLWSTNLYAEENQPNTAENQPTQKFASGIFSIGGGGFFPGGDLNNFNTGYNGTFSAGMTLGNAIGLGIDISYRESEQNNQYNSIYSSTNKISTFGMDYLFYLQPNHWRVQPYIAAGVGLYVNTLDNWQGYKLDPSTGIGYGVVGKAGIRFFITNNLFVGAYAKYFTNWQTLKTEYVSYYGNYVQDTNLNLGGLEGNIELGFKF
ncbi:MAG: hypothetical protein WAN57_05145 [Smithella sp.]